MAQTSASPPQVMRASLGIPILFAQSFTMCQIDFRRVTRMGRTWGDCMTETAHLKPVCQNGPYTAEGFRRTGTRRISSWPGETSPQNRPDTLTQTFFIHQLFPCIQTADHTLSRWDFCLNRARS